MLIRCYPRITFIKKGSQTETHLSAVFTNQWYVKISSGEIFPCIVCAKPLLNICACVKKIFRSDLGLITRSHGYNSRKWHCQAAVVSLLSFFFFSSVHPHRSNPPTVLTLVLGVHRYTLGCTHASVVGVCTRVLLRKGAMTGKSAATTIQVNHVIMQPTLCTLQKQCKSLLFAVDMHA